ncbi:MAG: 6,7-dimethyl-8-ribityllumazine synthase [Candidatus Peribacteraceae bacterium]|nr:6,7-dimethyl-8-ribityllumazine synthase [Candidatus Peribacteraceae bacterium]
MKFAVITSRFAEKAGKALEVLNTNCEQRLQDLKVNFEKFETPGAFEIPTLAKKVLQSGKYDAVICLGVVVRGETDHFDFVAGNCARKIADLGVEFAKPVIFGVLTTETTGQAEARAERGAEFATSAFSLAKELAKIGA